MFRICSAILLPPGSRVTKIGIFFAVSFFATSLTTVVFPQPSQPSKVMNRLLVFMVFLLLIDDDPAFDRLSDGEVVEIFEVRSDRDSVSQPGDFDAGVFPIELCDIKRRRLPFKIGRES